MDVQGSFLTSKSLMQIVRERRYLIASALSWVVMFTLTFAVLIPRIQDMMSAKQVLDDKTDVLTTLQNKANFLRAFQEEGFKQQNVRVARILPTSKPFLTLLSALEQLSSDKGVVFSGLDINPGPISSQEAEPTAMADQQTTSKNTSQTNDVLQSVELEMRTLGTAENLNGFLEGLGTVTPVIDIRTFTLIPKTIAQKDKTPAASESDKLYEARIKLSVMYAPLTARVEALKSLPSLTTDEQKYGENDLAKYTVYEATTIPLQPTDGTQGKENPFSL